jgi:hypothetical protein
MAFMPRLAALLALALLAACGGPQPPVLQEVRPAPAQPPASRALADPAPGLLSGN